MWCVSRSCSQPSTSTPTSPQHGHVECRRCHRHVFLPRPRDKNSLKTGAGVDIKPLLCCSFSSPCPGLCAVSTQPPAASLGTLSRTQGSNANCIKTSISINISTLQHSIYYLHISTAAQYLHIYTAAQYLLSTYLHCSMYLCCDKRATTIFTRLRCSAVS